MLQSDLQGDSHHMVFWLIQMDFGFSLLLFLLFLSFNFEGAESSAPLQGLVH